MGRTFQGIHDIYTEIRELGRGAFGTVFEMDSEALELGFTGTTGVEGTLDYLSPERREPGHRPDPKDDLFSAGVVFFRKQKKSFYRGLVAGSLLAMFPGYMLLVFGILFQEQSFVLPFDPVFFLLAIPAVLAVVLFFPFFLSLRLKTHADKQSKAG